MLRHYEERKEADDMNKQTRKITEGAMMCAIVGLVLFINRQLGNMLEYFMYWVLTFPILVYTAKIRSAQCTGSLCQYAAAFLHDQLTDNDLLSLQLHRCGTCIWWRGEKRLEERYAACFQRYLHILFLSGHNRFACGCIRV